MMESNLHTTEEIKIKNHNNILWCNYFFQKQNYWPKSGKHILAQYDENSVIVYQAYNPRIATYAIENQKFGGADFNFNRMSWIKTNFLWMMYRSNWALKPNQERILCVKINRNAFDNILKNAYTANLQKEEGISEIHVRLQWDPDHYPNGDKHPSRRAVQLGLSGTILMDYGTKDIVSITDITDMVHQQYDKLKSTSGGLAFLETPLEKIYPIDDEVVKRRIEVENCENIEYDR